MKVPFPPHMCICPERDMVADASLQETQVAINRSRKGRRQGGRKEDYWKTYGIFYKYYIRISRK